MTHSCCCFSSPGALTFFMSRYVITSPKWALLLGSHSLLCFASFPLVNPCSECKVWSTLASDRIIGFIYSYCYYYFFYFNFIPPTGGRTGRWNVMYYIPLRRVVWHFLLFFFLLHFIWKHVRLLFILLVGGVLTRGADMWVSRCLFIYLFIYLSVSLVLLAV